MMLDCNRFIFDRNAKEAIKDALEEKLKVYNFPHHRDEAEEDEKDNLDEPDTDDEEDTLDDMNKERTVPKHIAGPSKLLNTSASCSPPIKLR